MRKVASSGSLLSPLYRSPGIKTFKVPHHQKAVTWPIVNELLELNRTAIT